MLQAARQRAQTRRVIKGTTLYVPQITLRLASSSQAMGGNLLLVLPTGIGFVGFACHQGSFMCVFEALLPAAVACRGPMRWRSCNVRQWVLFDQRMRMKDHGDAQARWH